MNRDNFSCFARGAKDGVPIMLGYFGVGFSLGIVARNVGLTPFQGFLSSALNNASAGQYACYSLMAAGAGYIELAVMIFVANARYMLMSCALSQKVAPDTPLLSRMAMAFYLTDEIFGIGIAQEGRLNPYYMYGAASVAAPGWAFGTLFGIIMGNVLPARIVSALGLGLFGMFIAIIIPPARRDKIIRMLVFISMAASFLFSRFSFGVSEGMRTIFLTVCISCGAAFLFPMKEGEDDAE